MIDETELQSGFSGDHIAREDDLHRTPLADEPGQPLRPTAAWHYAEINFRLREPGVLAAYPKVARERQLIAAAEAKAIDHRNRRFRERIDRVEKRLFVKQVPLSNRCLPGELANVGTRDKRLLSRSGDHQNPNRIIAPQFVECSDAFRMNLFVQRIQLVRTIDRQNRDAVFLFLYS